MEQSAASLDITTNHGHRRTTVVDQPASVPRSTEVPEKIDRYEVRSLIGQGGFGRIFLAYDPQLQRSLAIKVPRAGRDWTRANIDAFLREARVAVKLTHPNVVAVHDVGTSAECGFYIAMEYVDGESLQTRLQRGPMDLHEIAKVISGIAAATHYAHQHGIVHRDLKPANVLIDSAGQIKVADFGLAVSEEFQTRLQGEVSGTPTYMSPEQVRGEVHRLDGRSDLWSLGVILYECLTAQRPFQGERWLDIREDILQKAPKPPRQIQHSIPRTVEAICLACLEKEALRRPSTAMEVADVLCRAVAPRSPRAWVVAASVLLLLGAWLTFGQRSHSRSDGKSPIVAAIGGGGRPVVDRPQGPAWSVMQPFCFDHGGEGNTYFYDPIRRVFRIESAAPAAFTVQPLLSHSFLLKADGHVDAQSQFGVIWSIQEITTAPLNTIQKATAAQTLGSAGWKFPQLNHAFSACAAVFVPKGLGDRPCLRIGRFIFAGTTRETVGIFESGTIEEIPVEQDASVSHCRLAVEVHEGQLQQVWFQGRAVATQKHQQVIPTDPTAPSTVGILGAYGTVTVSDFTLTHQGPRK